MEESHARHHQQQQWSTNLDSLEKETTSVLKRFGSARNLKKKNRFSSDRRFPATRPSSAPYRNKQSNNHGTFDTVYRKKPHSVPSTCSLVVKNSKNDAASRIIQNAFRRQRTKKLPGTATSPSPPTCLPIITNDLQTDAIRESTSRMFRDDGGSTLHLRDAIASAFTTNKFDSVSTLMFHQSSVTARNRKNVMVGDVGDENEEDEYNYLYKSGRKKMVSALTMKSGRGKEESKELVKSKSSRIATADTLSIRDVQYPGYEKQKKSTKPDSLAKEERSGDKEGKVREMCFNCWSARCSKCGLEQRAHENEAINISTPFCERWDSQSLRQSYRSEDIELNRATSLSSLRFAKDRRRRSAIKEHRHPLFMSLSAHVTNANYRARRRLHTQRWFQSLVDHVKYDSIQSDRGREIAREMRRKSTLMTSCRLERVTLKINEHLPRAPVSGSDPLEGDLIHDLEYVTNQGTIAKSRIISTQPILRPDKLHRIPFSNAQPPVKVELERFSGAVDSDNVVELVIHGSFGKQKIQGTASDYGSSSEVVFTQDVVSPISILHCNYNILDSLVFTPSVTPESLIPSHKLEVELIPLKYVERPLEHALNHRRVPTIMIKTGIDPNDRHYFGLNRPEQTGETEDFGFRTSESVEQPQLETHIETHTFIPVEDVVSPNIPRVLPTNAAKADSNYPILEVKSRINSITDLAHMLDVRRSCTPNKPQIFTVMTNQQRPERLSTFVVRSWSFVQKKRVAMFRTDDGVPYWYDRRTGETFWERPLYAEEMLPVKDGGVILGKENDFNINSAYQFQNAMGARSNLRKIILHPHESEDGRAERGRAAQRTRPTTKPEGSSFVSKPIPRRTEQHSLGPITKMPSHRRPMSAPIQRTDTRSKDDRSRRHRNQEFLQNQVESEVIAGVEKGIDTIEPGSLTETINEQNNDNVSHHSNVSSNRRRIDHNDTIHFPKRVQSVGDLKFDSEQLVTSITTALDDVVRQLSSEKDILKLGVGLGMSLGAQGMLNITSDKVNNLDGEDFSTQLSDTGNPDGNYLEEMQTSEHSSCDSSQISQVETIANTNFLLEEAAMHPYDNTSESNDDPGPLVVAQEESLLPSIDVYKTTDSATFDFLQVIKRRRTGKQYVDYIPSTPNLPESKPVGRVKPRSAGKDWQTIGFDPWSAGKDLLTVQFVPTMALVPSLRKESTRDKILSSDPLASQLDFDESKDDKSSREAFERASRCIRHGAFSELDRLLNDSDYAAPIDYEDDVGNTLLMICCQNGNKKMSKLILRKGCDLNKQNCNGQSCLHYAFAYGFDSLGEYLISKGADDSLLNTDGLTCYEGLSMEDVTNL